MNNLSRRQFLRVTMHMDEIERIRTADWWHALTLLRLR